MYFIYCILLIAMGAGLAMFGLKRFGVSLALAFALPTLALLGMLDYINIYSVLIVSGIAALIFFLTTPLTYFNAWFFGTILICLPFIIIYDAVGLEGDRIVKSTVYISMAISLVATIILRRHLKVIIVGISSGYSLGLGLAGIISYKLFQSGNILDALALPGILVLIGIIAGILFQYLYIAKKDPSLIDPTKSFETKSSEKVLSEQDKGSSKKIYIAIIGGVFIIILAMFLLPKSPTDGLEDNKSIVISDTIQEEKSAVNDNTVVSDTNEIILEKVTTNEPLIVDNTNDYSIYSDLKLILDGNWQGDFGDKTLLLDLVANEDGTISGVNKVGENSRLVSGSFSGDLTFVEMKLSEPGDDEWDGVFEIEVSQMGAYNYEMSGTWKSNNGKITRDFTLQRQ